MEPLTATRGEQSALEVHTPEFDAPELDVLAYRTKPQVASPDTSSNGQHCTYHDLCELEAEEGYFYELLEGIIVKRASPLPEHQRIVRRLLVALDRYCAEHSAGEVFSAPLDVVLDEYNVPQPDIFFIAAERNNIVRREGIFGAPDMVVEILSPSSIRRDRVQKMKLYHRFGVREFWLVDPNNTSVEVYVFTESGYELAEFAAENGVVQSSVLSGFQVDVAILFAL
jgi:Uma2 family endonuclease